MKFCRIPTFVRDTLHWFPVLQRIQYKIVTLMCNYLVGVAPSDLKPVVPRSLHSLVAPLSSRSPEAFWLFPTCAGLLLNLEALSTPPVGTIFRRKCGLSSSVFLFPCSGKA